MDQYKRITAQRLRFPTKLKFTSADNGLLQCNGKLVQVIPSLPIGSNDNPPTDLPILGIGKHVFKLADADIIILSFVNSQTQKTDCAILPKDELLNRLEDYHKDGDQLNLKLVLTERGLHECYNAGAEGWFMGLWVDEKRNFSEYHNSWNVFEL